MRDDDVPESTKPRRVRFGRVLVAGRVMSISAPRVVDVVDLRSATSFRIMWDSSPSEQLGLRERWERWERELELEGERRRVRLLDRLRWFLLCSWRPRELFPLFEELLLLLELFDGF